MAEKNERVWEGKDHAWDLIDIYNSSVDKQPDQEEHQIIYTRDAFPHPNQAPRSVDSPALSASQETRSYRRNRRGTDLFSVSGKIRGAEGVAMSTYIL